MHGTAVADICESASGGRRPHGILMLDRAGMNVSGDTYVSPSYHIAKNQSLDSQLHRIDI
jgi:hypothetical protein